MEKTPHVVLEFDLNELPLDMNEEPIDDVEPPQVDMNEEQNDDVAPRSVDINEEPVDDVVPPQVDMNEEPTVDVLALPIDMNEEPDDDDDMAPLPVDMNEESNDDVVPPPVDTNEEQNDDVAPPSVDMNEEQNDDVALPPPFCIRLCFHKEDMEVLKRKYKVLKSSSSVEKDEYLNKLGFPGGIHTLMRIRNKKIRLPRGLPYVLGRCWLQEVTRKDEGVDWMVSLEGNKGKDKGKTKESDHLEAKKLLQEFVMLAKARISDVGKKGKKKVHFRPPPFRGIKKDKFFAMKQSLKPIVIFGEEQYVWNPFV